MKHTHGFKSAKWLAVLAGIGCLLSVWAGDGESVEQEIRSVLKNRIRLLSRLVDDYGKQYKTGSIDGQKLLSAQLEWYTARLLLMKSEAGRRAEPGLAVALLRFMMMSEWMKSNEKNFAGGQLGVSNLLNAQLAVNEAELQYLTVLRNHAYNAEKLRQIMKNPPKMSLFAPLNEAFLRALLDVEETKGK